jgi:hypothetical protein
MARRALLAVVVLACMIPQASGVYAAAAQAALDERVRAASLKVYVHGMTSEIAQAEIGPEGLPALLSLLEDASFPRRDNVVAFLAYLGGRESTQPLLRLMGRPFSEGVPEEERARLLVPHALGRIAGRGESGALDALLAMTAHHAGGGPIAAAAAAGAFSQGMRDDLVDAAINALALAGAGRARERLAAIASGRVAPDAARPDLSKTARSAMEILSSAGSPGRSALLGAAGPVAAAVSFVADPAARSVAHGLSFTNHVTVTNPMTAARLDAVLAESSFRAAKGDYSTDVACCAVVSRVGAGSTWGTAADGLSIIDTAAELSAVLGQSGGRAKVVRVINYCGGSGTNIIGCSYQPGNSMALVRMSDLGYEAVLWIHEYGHNLGLAHASDGRALMAPSDSGTNDGLSVSECAAFHDPDYADPIDNCPGVANENQADSNHNGLGDACEAPAALVADIDQSGRVDGFDLARLGRAFGSHTGNANFDPSADLDQNGVIDGADLALLAAEFGKSS